MTAVADRNFSARPGVFGKAEMKSPALLRPMKRREFVRGATLAVGALALGRRSWGAEPPARQLGVALVGLGNYSRGQLGPALRETKHCRLAGVVTGTPAKAVQWQRDYGIPAQNVYNYGTMERMADNPDIDIVYVVTPPGLHAEHAIRAAQAGKHVICEKPMANTVAECDAIIAACRAAKVRLSLGYRLHFDPHHQELMRLAREKDFGAFTNMTGDRGFVLKSRVWRADKKLAGGGPIMDVGIYLIQAACMAADGVAPVAVTAREGPKTRPEIFADVEETMHWTMEFLDGAVCSAVTSYAHNADKFRAEGPRGWFEFKERAFAYRGIVGETSRGPLNYGPPLNQQAAQMDDFAQCVVAGRESRVAGEMGRRDLQIIEAIYAAAQSGKRVAV